MSPGEKYMALFSGREDAHGLGIGRIEKRPDKPLPTELYKLHLAGEGSGLGIFPLRDDGTVSFAVIDIDKPDFALAELLQDFLPGKTWIEKSRSGNAHVWAFFREPVPGWIPRGLMKFALEAVGEPNVEVFPKQDELKEGMVGNYINLPLHGADRPMMIPNKRGTLIEMQNLDREGEEHARIAWIEEAYANRIDPEEWRVRARALGIKPPAERKQSMNAGELGFLHDCAQHIYRERESNPVVAGHRSVVYFNVAKQFLNYKEMTEDEARLMLHEINEAADPPAPEREVDRIFNNARKGGFTGTGCDDPLMSPYVLDSCPIAN